MALLVVQYSHEGEHFKRVLFNRALKGFDVIDLTVMPSNERVNKSNLGVINGLTKKSMMEFLDQWDIDYKKDDDKNDLIDKIHDNWNGIFDDIAGVMGIPDVSQSVSLTNEILEEGNEKTTGLIFIKDNREFFAIKSSKVAGIAIVDVQEPASAVYVKEDVAPALRHLTKVAMEKFLHYFGLRQRNYKKEELPNAIEELWDERIKPNLRPFFPMTDPDDNLQTMLNKCPSVIELNTHPSKAGKEVEVGTVHAKFDRDGITTCFVFYYVKETRWGEFYDDLRVWVEEIGAYDEEDYNLTLERKGSFTISYETISSWGLPMDEVLEMTPHVRLLGGARAPKQDSKIVKARKAGEIKGMLEKKTGAVASSDDAIHTTLNNHLKEFVKASDSDPLNAMKVQVGLLELPEVESILDILIKKKDGGNNDAKLRSISSLFFGKNAKKISDKKDAYEETLDGMALLLLFCFNKIGENQKFQMPDLVALLEAEKNKKIGAMSASAGYTPMAEG